MPYHVLNMVFHRTRTLNLLKSNVSTFSLWIVFLVSNLRTLPNLISQRWSPVFTVFTFKFVVSFWGFFVFVAVRLFCFVFFVKSMRLRLRVFLWVCFFPSDVQFQQHLLLKNYLSFIKLLLHFHQNQGSCICVSLFLRSLFYSTDLPLHQHHQFLITVVM